jgi:hypothetical protein
MSFSIQKTLIFIRFAPVNPIEKIFLASTQPSPKMLIVIRCTSVIFRSQITQVCKGQAPNPNSPSLHS